ncbi:hypothetical protein Tco_1162677 [Tanacetum coccineum]
MIDCLSIVETDKVNHTVETDIVKLEVEIESFDMSSDEFDKETGSFDGLQPKQADLSCVHALNELHLQEIHVVPSTHEADQCTDISKITRKQSKNGQARTRESEEYKKKPKNLSLSQKQSKDGQIKSTQKDNVSLNLLSRTRKLGHSTMELRSLIS